MFFFHNTPIVQNIHITTVTPGPAKAVYYDNSVHFYTPFNNQTMTCDAVSAIDWLDIQHNKTGQVSTVLCVKLYTSTLSFLTFSSAETPFPLSRWNVPFMRDNLVSVLKCIPEVS